MLMCEGSLSQSSMAKLGLTSPISQPHSAPIAGGKVGRPLLGAAVISPRLALFLIGGGALVLELPCSSEA